MVIILVSVNYNNLDIQTVLLFFYLFFSQVFSFLRPAPKTTSMWSRFLSVWWMWSVKRWMKVWTETVQCPTTKTPVRRTRPLRDTAAVPAKTDSHRELLLTYSLLFEIIFAFLLLTQTASINHSVLFVDVDGQDRMAWIEIWLRQWSTWHSWRYCTAQRLEVHPHPLITLSPCSPSFLFFPQKRHVSMDLCVFSTCSLSHRIL